MKQLHIGVDLGFKGGIAVINEKGNLIYKTMMPILSNVKKYYDIREIIRIFIDLQQEHPGYKLNVILEKALIMPISGRIAVASTHYCLGLFEGILSSLNISYQVINPREWQKVVFVGMNSKETKLNSILFCEKKYPNEQFFSSKRAKKIADGLTDAVCIAYYSYLQK